MRNFIQDGNVITLVAPTGGVLSGQGFVVGAIFAVAAYDAAQGDEVEGQVVGVFTLPKSSGVIAEGAQVWWDDSGKTVENASGAGLFPIGTCVGGAADADPTARVRLDGVAVTAVAA
jgi:predicted RecA/RadA family phage recombinase